MGLLYMQTSPGKTERVKALPKSTLYAFSVASYIQLL